MNRFSKWLSSLPYVLMALVFAVIWGVPTGLVQLAVDPDPVEPDEFIIRGVGALIFGFIFAAIIRRRLRRSGGVILTVEISAAVRAGRLPPEATADEWLPVLRYSLGRSERSLWLAPIVFGLFAALGVFIAVTADSPRSLTLGMVCAVLFVAIAVWTAVATRRRLPVVLRFIAELDEKPTA